MSEYKNGDRVRIVVEGNFIDADGEGFTFVVDDGWRDYCEIGSQGVVSVEVIPQPFVLPTKRWAQVLDGDNVLWTLTDETTRVSEWLSLQGSLLYGYQLLERPRLRVISEGVDE
jgi:hypothetical protein